MRTALLLFAFILAACSTGLGASAKVDSLKAELQKKQSDTACVKTLNALAWKLRIEQTPEAIKYLEEGLELAEKAGYKKGEANLHHTYASLHYNKGNYPKALSHNFKALEIRKQLNDKKVISTSLGNIGLVYKEQGDYPKALKHYFEALEIAKEIGNKRHIATFLGNIGIVYDDQGDYPKALKHYFEAYEIDKELGDKAGMAADLGNIGIVYHEQASALSRTVGREAKSRQDIAGSDSLYQKALKHYFEALEIDKELGNKNGIARRLGNIGVVYMEQGEYPKALKHYFEALEIDKELGRKSGIAIRLGNIGYLYTKTGRFKEAEQYLDSALAIDIEIGRISGQMYRYEALSHLYDTLAQLSPLSRQQAESWKLAYHRFKKYSAAKDILFSEEKSKEIGGLEARHEWEMRELEQKKIKNEEIRIKNEEIKRKNMLQYSGIALVLAILVVGLLYSRRLFALLPKRIPLLFRGQVGPAAIALGLLFATVFIFFETILIYFDADIETFTQGKVVSKTLLSVLFAGTVSIVYYLLEGKLEKKLGFPVIKTKGNSLKAMGIFLLIILSQSFTNDTIQNDSSKLQQLKFPLIGGTEGGLIDSLKAELQKNLPDTARVKALNALSWKLRIEQTPEAIKYLEEGLELAEKAGYKKGEANLHHTYASLYYNKGNYPKALSHNFKALEIRKQLNDQKGIASTLGSIGNVYISQGDYPEALKHYFEALEIKKNIHHQNPTTASAKAMAATVGNIGLVYRNQGDYPEALKHYFEYLKIAKELGIKQYQAIALGNIGNVYNSQGDYPEALKHYFEALEIAKELGNKSHIATFLGNIGIVYYEQGDYLEALTAPAEALYAKALEHYFEALEIDKELGNKRGMAIRFGNIGSLYTQTGRFKEAEQYLNSALALADSIGAFNEYMQFEEIISHLYDTLAQLSPHSKGQAENWKLAYRHYKKYDTAKDTLYNEEKSKEIGKLETRHEMEIAAFNRRQKEERQAEAARIKKAREDKIGYTLVLVGFIAVLAMIMLLSRLALPQAIIQIATTIPFLLLFETAIVFMDPYIEAVADNAPALKLSGNFFLALCLFPLHNKAEQILKRLFRKKLRRKVEQRHKS